MTVHAPYASKPCNVTVTDEVVAAESFGVSDERGRVIGVVVVTKTETFALSGAEYGYYVVPGNYYFAKVQPTRDGAPFGATQGDNRFATAALRDAYVSKRLTAARKDAAKKFAA